KNFGDVKFLSNLLKEDITVRYAMKPFSIDGREYAAGTLIITRDGNTEWGSEFDSLIQESAANHKIELHAVSSGLVTTGSDFGSSNVQLVRDAKVALLSGAGTSSGMVGQI